MRDKSHAPRNNNSFSVNRLETLLDCALEHASHGWTAFEKENQVNRINPESWPPQVEAEVGSAQYHLANTISYVFEAYQLLRKEQEHTETVMEKVNKVLGNDPR
jgi:hypothetical protein